MTTEPTPAPLVPLATTIQTFRADARRDGRDLDDTYKWDSDTIAEVLLDQDEQVFTWQGVYLIPADVADKLRAFLADFTTTPTEGAHRA